MKEATGELNMTVITVVAIAAVAAFFYAFVWPAIKNNITSGTNCASAYGCNADGSKCYYRDDKNTEKEVNCKAYFDKNGNPANQ